MREPEPVDARDHEFREITPVRGAPLNHLELRHLGKVRLQLTADLGRRRMLVRDILDLKRGSVVTLDKLAGEMTDIYVNGLPLARGEVVVIGDTLHVRIAEIIGMQEKADDSSAKG